MCHLARGRLVKVIEVFGLACGDVYFLTPTKAPCQVQYETGLLATSFVFNPELYVLLVNATTQVYFWFVQYEGVCFFLSFLKLTSEYHPKVVAVKLFELIFLHVSSG